MWVSPTRVTGIIDFGDAVFAPLICEVATALAYQVGDGADSAGTCCAVYCRVSPAQAVSPGGDCTVAGFDCDPHGADPDDCAVAGITLPRQSGVSAA
nr:phosphotransferase [Pectobacterium colocasium]